MERMNRGDSNGFRNILLGALVVAVAVLGYFLYQETQNPDTVEMKLQLPDVQIERN
jgi:hypothetical protein